MKTRRYALYGLGGVTLAILAACAAPSPTNGGTPTPTPSVTPSGPPFSGLAAWTSKNQTELWLGGQTSFRGSVTAIAATSNGSSGTIYDLIPNPPVPVTFPGEHHAFLVYSTASSSIPQAPYLFSIDFDVGTVLHSSAYTVAVGSQPRPPSAFGDQVLSSVSAKKSATTGKFRMLFNAAQAVTISEVRLYDSAGNSVGSCPQAPAYTAVLSPNTLDACSFSQISVVGGHYYEILLRGGAPAGSTSQTEYFQFIPFPPGVFYNSAASFAP